MKKLRHYEPIYAGVQRREIKCRPRCRSTRRRRRWQTGSSPGMPCAMFRAPPEAERACAVECRRDCVTTDVGPETGCGTCWSRSSVRHRSVLLDERAGGRQCTDLAEVTPCPHQAECTLRYRPSNHRYRLGQWTDCAAFHPSQAVATFGARDRADDRGSTSRGFTSVIGYRRRSVECINVSGSTVDKRSVVTAPV